MSLKAGRKMAFVKQFIGPMLPQGFKCKLCGTTKEGKAWTATLWAEHIVLQCQKATPEQRAQVAHHHNTKNIRAQYAPSASRPRDSDELDDAPPAKRARGGMEGHVDTCDAARLERIHMRVARLICGCALPFRIVVSPYFIELLQECNSAIGGRLAKDDAFRTKWVPELYRTVCGQINEMWKALGYPLRTVGFDGFKSESGDHVVNVTETARDKTAFKKCVDPGEKHEDAEFYADLVEKELEEGASAAGKSVEETYAGVRMIVLSLAVQSADVERVCKAHKVIHTKARNRLLTKTVQMLLYTYCNLRLLDASPELGDFLVDAMKGSVDDDETELAAGPTEDTDDDDDDDDEEEEVDENPEVAGTTI